MRNWKQGGGRIMTNKKLPTVDIKGKDYVLVKDRIMAFNEAYPNGYIRTELVSPIESQIVIVKAIVTPDVDKPNRQFIDYSQETIGKGYINQTSALENASTSAVGRALAFLGIGIIESVASADEVKKALKSQPEASRTPVWDKEWPSGNEENNECTHPYFSILEVKKEGPNKGRQFTICKTCQKFLGFVPEKTEEEEEEVEYGKVDTLNMSTEMHGN